MILVVFLLMQSYKTRSKGKNNAPAKISQARKNKCLIFNYLQLGRFREISQSR